jgi:hypothetical protein
MREDTVSGKEARVGGCGGFVSNTPVAEDAEAPELRIDDGIE